MPVHGRAGIAEALHRRHLLPRRVGGRGAFGHRRLLTGQRRVGARLLGKIPHRHAWKKLRHAQSDWHVDHHPDEIADPEALTLTLSVNGQAATARQHEDMIYPIAAQIAHLLTVVTLEPGD